VRIRGRHHEPQNPTQLGRLVYGAVFARLITWILFWVAVWVVVWVVAPGLLVHTRAGLETVNQALPGALVALLALVVASAFVLASQMVTLYGSRSVLVLLFEPRILILILRALTLTAASLLLGGQIPDAGPTQSAVTAAVTTLVLASVVLLAQAVATLGVQFASYTAPRNFMLAVTRGVEDFLSFGAVDFVVFRVPLLGEMARSGVRRGESVALVAALEGLLMIQDFYLRVVHARPEIQNQPAEDGSATRAGWLAQDLSAALARTGEDALKSSAAEQDMDAVAEALQTVARRFVEEGLEKEALPVVEAITRLGVTSHQVSAQAVNIWSYSAPTLARIEALAEERSQGEVAVEAAANWALVVSYAATHFGIEHPLFEPSIGEFGKQPPWDDALGRIEDVAWQQRWANKLEAGAKLPRACLEYAAGRGPHPATIKP
jgi:hypothetical protein